MHYETLTIPLAALIYVLVFFLVRRRLFPEMERGEKIESKRKLMMLGLVLISSFSTMYAAKFIGRSLNEKFVERPTECFNETNPSCSVNSEKAEFDSNVEAVINGDTATALHIETLLNSSTETDVKVSETDKSPENLGNELLDYESERLHASIDSIVKTLGLDSTSSDYIRDISQIKALADKKIAFRESQLMKQFSGLDLESLSPIDLAEQQDLFNEKLLELKSERSISSASFENDLLSLLNGDQVSQLRTHESIIAKDVGEIIAGRSMESISSIIGSLSEEQRSKIAQIPARVAETADTTVNPLGFSIQVNDSSNVSLYQVDSREYLMRSVEEMYSILNEEQRVFINIDAMRRAMITGQ